MDIKLPNLGEGAESGVVVSILVNVGDEISEGQNIIELETGKAVASIPASAGGKVESIRVKVGDKITPGTVILTVSGGGAPAAAPAPAPAAAKARPAPARPAAPPPAEEAAPAEEVETEAEAMPSVESTEQYFTPPASPTIRKLARELGIDLRRVKGSQHGGRIVMEDLRRYIQGLIRAVEKARSAPATPAAGGPAAAAPVSIDFAQWGPVTRAPFSPLRQVLSRRLVESVNTLPQVTQFDEADITGLLALRQQYAAAYEAKGARLTLTGFAMIALVAVLKKHPIFNSSLDEVTQEIVYKNYYHIGIAVDTEAGLLVPVIRDADRKSLLELSLALVEVANKARERKLAPADMQGGTCTISNQGPLGGGHFTPIVNKPECAILGLGRGALKPVVQPDGAVAPRTLLPLALSYDHRLVDGAQAARFITDLRAFLENFPAELVKI
ncbi:MAG: 2-oxo acid dehydrogenase subunit E2 [Verrucomicrobiae bacterium]|nr:2-oxo acid dehydrogenase subunit E2 [Verrucomicrobiae bacterium]